MFRRQPDSELDHLHDHIERIWERLTQGGPAASGYCPAGIEPPTDVLVSDEVIVVRMELAGLRGSELDVEVEGTRLTVRGTKQEPPRPASAQYAQMEIMGGAFERSITLPAQVNAEGASVDYANGYLEIRLPRVARMNGRSVRVPVHRG